jgi:hypothetical protein
MAGNALLLSTTSFLSVAVMIVLLLVVVSLPAAVDASVSLFIHFSL